MLYLEADLREIAADVASAAYGSVRRADDGLTLFVTGRRSWTIAREAPMFVLLSAPVRDPEGRWAYWGESSLRDRLLMSAPLCDGCGEPFVMHFKGWPHPLRCQQYVANVGAVGEAAA